MIAEQLTYSSQVSRYSIVEGRLKQAISTLPTRINSNPNPDNVPDEAETATVLRRPPGSAPPSHRRIIPSRRWVEPEDFLDLSTIPEPCKSQTFASLESRQRRAGPVGNSQEGVE